MGVGWLITVPVWGTSYIERYLAATLPAVNAALEHTSLPVRFIVHTDNERAFTNARFGGDVEFHPVPAGNDGYEIYGACNRQALEMAKPNEYIMLTGCDTIISREFFAACERRFAEGYRAIFGTAARTIAEPDDIPIGASSRELLNWSFDRRHPATNGGFWLQGCNVQAWAIYFEGPKGIVCRSFHLPPFAVMNDRHLFFQNTTVDLDLVERFQFDEIFVITDADECAFAEISDNNGKPVTQGPPMCHETVVNWAMQLASPWHCHLFRSRITVQGTDEDGIDIEPCNAIMREIYRRHGKQFVE